MPRADLSTTLFVYGTRKRGQWTTAREANGEQATGLAEGRHCRRQGATFHSRFCSHATDVRPATIVGRLYQLPAGFPAVVIPEEAILAHGTADPLADARTQAEFAARGATVPEVEGDWDAVHGEVITFPNPVRDLPPIDRLEGFGPDGRILIAGSSSWPGPGCMPRRCGCTTWRARPQAHGWRTDAGWDEPSRVARATRRGAEAREPGGASPGSLKPGGCRCYTVVVWSDRDNGPPCRRDEWGRGLSQQTHHVSPPEVTHGTAMVGRLGPR
jgi:gamma-glutamylcyclotransferase (GGCT)/AIG2-like uncharacterized protein YtfP